jgi:hypothetical protein
MLDSRQISVGHFQPLHSFFYNFNVIVMRPQDTGTPNSGVLGSNNLSFTEIVRSWPLAMAPVKGDLINFPEGQTDLADYTATSRYHTLTDGSMIIQARDVLIDQQTGTEYLVLWAYNAGGAKQQINILLKQGVVGQTFMV